MDEAEFAQVAAAFATFHAQFAPLFGRKEAQAHGEQYVRGLLVQQTDRRNAENVAEVLDGVSARSLQRFLTDAPWESGPVITRLQAFLGPRLSTPEGIWIIDESGFPKQGRSSVGVGHQYCGRLGKLANCQVGVFLAYASARGHALVDGQLFLPEKWVDDRERCQAAGVPAEIGFATKAEIGLALLQAARARGHLQGDWVTGDAGYGEVPSLRDALDADGWRYVLEVPLHTRVFTQPAAVAVPPWSGRGPHPTLPRLVPGTPPPQTVRAVAEALDAGAWADLTVADGAQGPRTYQFARLRVWESRDGLPDRACWLLLRRTLAGGELKAAFSNAAQDTPLLTLAQVGAARWVVETELQTEKSETGLDEYEVRRWPGWHHHITLSLLAGAFLLQMQQDWGGKDAPDHPAPSLARAAGVAAPASVDRGRLAGLADRHPRPQRAGQMFPQQTASPSAA
jgi:SRSO17 transposase